MKPWGIIYPGKANRLLLTKPIFSGLCRFCDARQRAKSILGNDLRLKREAKTKSVRFVCDPGERGARFAASAVLSILYTHAHAGASMQDPAEARGRPGWAPGSLAARLPDPKWLFFLALRTLHPYRALRDRSLADGLRAPKFCCVPERARRVWFLPDPPARLVQNCLIKLVLTFSGPKPWDCRPRLGYSKRGIRLFVATAANACRWLLQTYHSQLLSQAPFSIGDAV